MTAPLSLANALFEEKISPYQNFGAARSKVAGGKSPPVGRMWLWQFLHRSALGRPRSSDFASNARGTVRSP